jgi:hypothetical protein
MSAPLQPLDTRTAVLEIHDTDAILVTLDGRTAVLEVPTESSVLVQNLPARVETIEILTPGVPGPVGPQGDQGLQGVQGEKGEVGAQGPPAPIFEQHFAIPLLVWHITHDLDAFPVVTIVDLDGQELGATVTTPDKSTVIVTFAIPMAGTARLKA